MSNSRLNFSLRPIIELACILAAVQTASWPFNNVATALPTSNTATVFLLFGIAWCLVTRWLGSRSAATWSNRVRALQHTTMMWGLTGACAGLLAISTLNLPVLSILLTLLYGWTLLALLCLLRTSALRVLDVSSLLGDTATTNGLEPSVAGPHNNHADANASGSALYYSPTVDRNNANRDSRVTGEPDGWQAPAACNQPLGRLIKRAIDVVGSAAGIVVLLPVFVACALAVKLTSKGPTFFRQTRVGKNGAAFTCLKFRSMTRDAQEQLDLLRSASTQDGPAFKMPNDPRVTSVGRFLRKYSLDELPQLFNVLFGHMSLVGPRPPVPREVEEYAPWQLRRISIKPGLTCIWQVWGRNQVSFNRWIEMDLAYIDNWSVWLDIKLIIHTVPAMVKGTGM